MLTPFGTITPVAGCSKESYEFLGAATELLDVGGTRGARRHQYPKT
jgi:hypothetical protein